MDFGISKLCLQIAKDFADWRVLPCIPYGEDTGEVGLALAGCPLGAGMAVAGGLPRGGRGASPLHELQSTGKSCSVLLLEPRGHLG